MVNGRFKPILASPLKVNFIKGDLQRGMKQAARELESLYKMDIRSWNTKVSFNKESGVTRAQAFARVTTTNNIYKFQHDGTKGPYTIVPVRARKLRFEIKGRVIYADKVTHPGLTARNYTKRIKAQWRLKFRRICAQSLKKASK